MKKASLLLACAAGALLLSGCDFKFQNYVDGIFGAQKKITATTPTNANDPVLLKIDGEPALRKTEFLDFCEQAMKANPYLSSFGIVSYETAPEPIKQQLLDASVQQKLIARWGENERIENTDQYKEMYAKMAEQLRQALLAQAFEKQIFETIAVSDEEIADEFQKNREQMIKDPGSVKVVGVVFKNEEKAKDFFARVAGEEESTLSELAHDSEVDVVEFGTVSLDLRTPAKEPVTAGIQRALSMLKDSEYYAQAKDQAGHWVLQVVDRIKPIYYVFDEVKDQLAQQVKHEKFKVVREARVNELRSAHTVDIDSSSLTSTQDPFALLQQMLGGRSEMSPELLQELEAAAQETAEEEQA